MGVLVLIPAAPLPIQLRACGLGKQWRIGLGTLNLVGDPEECRGSLLWIISVPAIGVAEGVNQWTVGLPICICSFAIKATRRKSNSLTFFFKDLFLLFIFLLERRIYREERQRGRCSVQ